MQNIFLHKGDLPSNITFSDAIAVDTETMGLQHHRDPLCVVQLSDGDGSAHLVQLDRTTYDAPNLKALLADSNRLKIFHFARFDVAAILRYLDVLCAPIFCTKIASKLVRTYTDRHGLKELAQQLANVELSKQQQSSDWGAPTLTEAQQQYAANDVLYLHKIKAALEIMLKREDRYDLAEEFFQFLPARALADLVGFGDEILTY